MYVIPIGKRFLHFHSPIHFKTCSIAWRFTILPSFSLSLCTDEYLNAWLCIDVDSFSFSTQNFSILDNWNSSPWLWAPIFIHLVNYIYHRYTYLQRIKSRLGNDNLNVLLKVGDQFELLENMYRKIVHVHIVWKMDIFLQSINI